MPVSAYMLFLYKGIAHIETCTVAGCIHKTKVFDIALITFPHGASKYFLYGVCNVIWPFREFVVIIIVVPVWYKDWALLRIFSATGRYSWCCGEAFDQRRFAYSYKNEKVFECKLIERQKVDREGELSSYYLNPRRQWYAGTRYPALVTDALFVAWHEAQPVQHCFQTRQQGPNKMISDHPTCLMAPIDLKTILRHRHCCFCCSSHFCCLLAWILRQYSGRRILRPSVVVGQPLCYRIFPNFHAKDNEKGRDTKQILACATFKVADPRPSSYAVGQRNCKVSVL